MRERPIIFSGPMVRAVLEGRKTVTRRIVKHIPWLPGRNPHFSQAMPFVNAGEWRIAGSEEMTHGFRCPYGQPGDRLWVRETFKPIASGEVKNGYGEVRYGYAYQADSSRRWNARPTTIHDLTGQPSKGPMQFQQRPWRSPATMPHRASRITLEVTGVRVERLQAIDRAGALAEGIVDMSTPSHTAFGVPGASLAQHPVRAFQLLWDSINGAGSWDANPWVWAIEFRRIEQERKAA
ncbi:hypothetical protein SAMN04487785_102436 [Dyella jiangningensis]|uniref:hypothetical protein n=1 Tax=Dyella sp. AtDHG13 TaxID=1938897 RepID=UPI000886344D|nr:hypothetical protein [Dyella sp. AtDHG13]PXV60708.1 hypothetical protein BDW41_102435 [Dyella sp. AtDHG13]SDJ55977.1 hypothetical protein SAMN04487785_102436 [Dyella jiangningensis]